VTLLGLMLIDKPTQQILIVAAAVLLAMGLWLMLPRGTVRGQALGVVLSAVALGLFAPQFGLLDNWVSDAVFFVMAGVTLVSAVGAVTMRSPVYCAIWFALTLLGTAGLFFFQGAQFLGVATIVVYAGAILVTFLFVLMLANPEGHALYDRLSWEAGISAGTGALLVGLLTWTITESALAPRLSPAAAAADSPQAQTATLAAERNHDILAANHVEKLGGNLFSKYLLAVEVAGTLLLVALVGAVAIAAHGESTRGESSKEEPAAGPSASARAAQTEGPAHG
jgi:NADH-quinone oxidoreductase subunit J